MITGASAVLTGGSGGGGVPSWKVYPTPRIVQIADGTLGIFRHTLLFLIFMFIVVFHIMFRGSHLVNVQVNGVVRQELLDPSEGSCDEFNQHKNCSLGFRSLSALPYCDSNNFTGTYQKPCEYWDSVELRQVSDGGMLVPTRVRSYRQKERCHPGPSNGWSCDGRLYKFIDSDGKVIYGDRPEPVRDTFIADIENFEILFDHSAHAISRDANVEEYDFQMVGSFLECSDEHPTASQSTDRRKMEYCVERPLICVHSHCPNGSTQPKAANLETTSERKHRSNLDRLEVDQSTRGSLEVDADPEEFALADKLLESDHTAVSTHKGDIFSIRSLVEAASVGLDAVVLHGSNQTYRNDGVTLVVRIEYTNDASWIGLRVSPWRPVGPAMRYKYRIMKHATGGIALRKVNFNRDKHGGNVREVDEYRGIRVVVEQTGTLRVWDNVQLMFLVTTTLALLAIAQCVMDHIALNCMANSPEYRRLKFEVVKEHMQP